tara:strand:- start:184 stop:387 length:204 start_codon:yes stop_codon:yes gene_type:complete
MMNEKMIEAIKNWETEYLSMNKSLSDREKELLKGDAIKSHEGMVFGRMYADWKKQKGFDDDNTTQRD